MTNTAATTARPRLARRVLPAIGLLFLAPWVAEYLLGTITIQDLPLLIFLVPMYGGGALLIREVARRTGRGWPTILLLGLAYGFVEAGLLDQGLFNPHFMGQDFQSAAHIPGVQVSAYSVLIFTAGHAIWSIGTPIAVVESFASSRGTAPWLGRAGLAAAAALYVLGAVIIYNDNRSTQGFQAAPRQVGATLAVVLLLVGAAFAVKPRRRYPGRKSPPRPLLVGTVALVAGVLYGLVLNPNWYGFVFGLAVLTVMARLVARWSRTPEWSQRHRLALATGALLTYAWFGFVQHPWRHTSAGLELLSDVTFALVALGLLLAARRRVYRVDRTRVDR
jgi:hypothetical protein